MSRMNVAVLAVMFMFFVGISFGWSDLGGGWCSCTLCSDCSSALNNNTICTNGAISDGSDLNTSSVCIYATSTMDGKTFDMNGSTIDDEPGPGGYGVYIDNVNGFVLANGTIRDMIGSGVYVNDSDDIDIYNVTVTLSFFNGIFVNQGSDDVVIDTCAVGLNIGWGVIINDSTNCVVRDSLVGLNGWAGLVLSGGGSGHDVYGNTIWANGVLPAGSGYGIHIWDTDSCEVWDNDVYSNKVGVIVNGGSLNTIRDMESYRNTGAVVGAGFACQQSATSAATGNIFSKVTAYDNSLYGIVIQNNCTIAQLRHSEFYNNTAAGIYLYNSEFLILQNNTAHNNTFNVGIDTANNSVLWDTHLYDAGFYDMRITAGNDFVIGFLNLILDRPAGDYTDFTNLSILTNITAHEDFRFNWSPTQALPSPDMVSFRNKFADITNDYGSGAGTLDQVYWTWTEAEEAGYFSAQFELWEQTGAVWSNMNAVLDTGNNFLLVNNLDPSSNYTIVQNLTACPVITAGGTYQLAADLVGAPNVYESFDYACIVINASNVDVDCAGYSITNNGVALGRAIAVNGSDSAYLTNVTVRNCEINDYYVALRSNAVSYGDYHNITAVNNSWRIFHLRNNTHTIAYNNTVTNATAGSGEGGFSVHGGGTYNVTLEHNVVSNAAGGFTIWNNAVNVTLYNNTATAPGGSAFDIRAENVTVRENLAYGAYSGFITDGAINTTFIDNVARDNLYGLALATGVDTYANNNLLANNTIGLHILDDANAVINNTILYNNSLYDFYMNESFVFAYSYVMEGSVFLNPLGTYVDYTNLSLQDNVGANNRYSISWTPNSTAIPAGSVSFEDKFVNITRYTGAVSIEEIVWTWTAGEEAGYTPSIFNLMKWNSGAGWTIENQTADTVGRTLSLYNVDPTSDYGILEFVSNVSIVKTDISVQPISQGGMVEFQLNITNEGNTTLNPVRVNDTLPVGLTYSNADLAPDTILGQQLIWDDVGPILGGNSVIILVNATVDNATTSGFYTNYAETEAQPSIGPNVTNASSVVVTVNDSAISVVKQSSVASAETGEKVTFNITITNTGEVNLTPVVAEDILPIGLQYVAGEAIPLPDDSGPYFLNWTTIPELAPGDIFVAEYNVTIISATTHENDVTVEGEPPNGNNVTDSAFVSILGIRPPGGGDDEEDLDIQPSYPQIVGQEGKIYVYSDADPIGGANVTVYYPTTSTWYYLADTVSSDGGTPFIPEHEGMHKAIAKKSGYNDGEQWFEVFPAEDDCVTDEDCPEGEICLDDECVPDECETDEDCPPEEVCLDGECVECEDDSDCPEGEICEENECVPDECETDEDCPPEEVCLDGECVDCIEDEDCPPGEICTEENECVECEDDSDCPEDMVCEDGECEEECSIDADCPDVEYCADGVCEEVECPCGEVADHTCIEYECCTDSDCPVGYICDPETHECECDELIIVVPEETEIGEEVEIIVTDCDGEPVSDGNVTIYVDDDPVGGGPTDENGRITFVPGEAGDYKVMVTKEGFLSADDEFVAVSGETIWDLIIRGVWIALFILLLIAIIYVIASRRKKRRPRDMEE
ncbi:MAG: DUF11 domain-containing protein [bacterium]|nr:DUF11 domain-containing protein [bacterium]